MRRYIRIPHDLAAEALTGKPAEVLEYSPDRVKGEPNMMFLRLRVDGVRYLVAVDADIGIAREAAT